MPNPKKCKCPCHWGGQRAAHAHPNMRCACYVEPMPNPNAQERAEKIANVYCESHNHQGEFKSCGLIQDIAAELEAYAEEKAFSLCAGIIAEQIAKEREACAKICGSISEHTNNEIWIVAGRHFAKVIRSRGEA